MSILMPGRKRVSISRDAAVEDGVYHVTQRAPGREMMFIEDADYLFFLKLLKKTIRKVPLDIYAFALMPNHVHLMLKATPKDMGAAMKTLFQSYAQAFNKKYERKGHVVCGTYRARYCDTAAYFLNISLYIHLNPLKARLVDDVYAYRWTSLSCYSNKSIVSFVNPRPVLNLFENVADPYLTYKSLISDIRAVRYRNILNDKHAMRSFNRDVTKLFAVMRGRYGFSPAVLKMIDDNMMIVRLRQKRENNAHFKDRKALHYCIEQLQSQGYTIREIATILNIDRTSVYRLLLPAESTTGLQPVR